MARQIKYSLLSETMKLFQSQSRNEDAQKNEVEQSNPTSQYGSVESDSIVQKNKVLEEDDAFALWLIAEDMKDIMKLAIPIFISMFSWIGMKTTDTALLGHVSAEALSASALSDLWTMCTGVLHQGRVLGILCTQAVGSGNKTLAGIYLQVSLVVLGMISILVIITWNLTEYVWLAFGESEELSADAGYYAKILSIAIPGQVIQSQLSQFFSSQKIMRPEVISSLVALAMNLLLGLIFVLGVPISGFSGYGFEACPIVTVLVQYIQVILFWLIFCKILGLHKESFAGWQLNEITRIRIRTFLDLYIPAALSLASDFWRMGVIGLMAAKLGDEEVGLFNTSYRIIWITLVLVGSISSSASISLGTRLGSGKPWAAKRAGYVGIFLSLAVLLTISAFMIPNIRNFGIIFTLDESLLDLFEECKYPFVATLFFMNLSVSIERIPMSMGRTKVVFWMGFIASWFGQVPGVFLFTRFWRNDLVGLYTGMAVGYLVLTALYSAITIKSDWKKYSDIAISRSEVDKKKDDLVS